MSRLKCDLCGKQYKRVGWYLRHVNLKNHFSPGMFVLQYSPDILGVSFTEILQKMSIDPEHQFKWLENVQSN